MDAFRFDVRRLLGADGEILAAAIQRLAQDLELPSRASLEHLARALARPGTCFLLATVDDEPVGYLSGFAFPSIEEDADQAYLFDVTVAARHRRRGVGRALVEAFLVWCRENGVTWAWVGTERDNLPARRAFEAAGAELAGESYAEYEFEP